MKKEKKQPENTSEQKKDKYGEEVKKKDSAAKKFFKFFGIGMAAFVGLIAVAVIIAVASGVWSGKKIQIQTLSFETEFATENSNPTSIRVVDDFKIKINYEPKNATELDVDLRLVNAASSGILEFPEKVKAGQEITIKVAKDAKGNNVGGEVSLQAKTQLVVTQSNLNVFVDVPIPTDGLKLVSNYDERDITSGSGVVNFYVFTDPASAINPHLGTNSELYKNISLISGDSQSLLINNTKTYGVGFYCADCVKFNQEPFRATTETTHKHGEANISNSTLGSPIKYVKFTATASGSTAVPIVVTAQALRTYAMQEEYVSINDAKYNVENGMRLFFEDLSNYIEKYKIYINADTRSFTYQGTTYSSGEDFITKVTREGKVSIRDNETTAYNAALFYLFVQARKAYNVENIDVASISSTLTVGEPISFNLHANTVQLNFNEFKNKFGLILNPTNTDAFTSADLENRIRELKIVCVMDKAQNDQSDIEYNNYVFEIENPSDLIQPIWKINCINPVNATDRTRNVRLRVYLPSNSTGEFNDKCIYYDFPINVNVNGIRTFDFKTNHGIVTSMIVNNQNIGSSVHKQELTANSYTLVGFNGSAPTYNTVKWFVTTDSVKTLGADGTTRSEFFKIKLTNTGTPKSYTMPIEEGGTISAYEIAYTEGGKLMLEALNVSNVYKDDPLRIFAAVVKTNHENIPVDSEGRPQYVYDSTAQDYVLNAEFNGYVLIKTTSTDNSGTSYIEITTEYYLEKVNIYTVSETNGNKRYDLRNVPTSGDGEIPQIKLLAGETYKLYATGYKLLDGGSIDTGYYTNNDGIDYVSNIKYAMDKAYSSKSVKFRVNNSQDNKQYVEELEDFTVDADGLWTFNVNALIDKTATNTQTGAFDIRAYGSGYWQDVFKSNESTVNLKVNYAEITGFDFKTNFIETHPDTLNEYVYNNSFILRPQITSLTGIEWRASVNDGGDIVNSERQFDFDFEYGNDLIITTEEFNRDKIDPSYYNAEYVNRYINDLFNPNGTNIGINWFVTFADGSTTKGGESISDYLTVRHDILYVDTELEDGTTSRKYYFKPILNIKKGSTEGTEVIINCSIGLYKTNTGFIQQEQTSLNLTLIQSRVEFEKYSEKEDASGRPIFVVNGTGEESALVMEGGQEINLLENISPSNESGYNVYRLKDNDYVPVLDKDNNQISRNYRIIANLDTDNKLAEFCTYSIVRGGIGSPIYFKDASGNRVYTLTPSVVEDKPDKQLIVFADYISNTSEATIRVTSPFGDDSTTYQVRVHSSVTLSRPSSNIQTSTTKNNEVNGIVANIEGSSEPLTTKGNINLANHFTATHDSKNLYVSFEVADSESSLYGKTFVNNTSSVQEIDVKVGSSIVRKPLKTIFYPSEVYEDKTVKLTMYYYFKQPDDTAYTEYVVNRIEDNDISIRVVSGYNIALNIGTNFSETSGSTIDLFTTYGQNQENFIKITNKTTGLDVPTEEIVNVLKRLISFEIDTVNTSEEVIAKLFASEEDKKLLNNGILKTISTNTNETLSLLVKFKAGFNGETIQSLGDQAKFNIKLNAALEYKVSGNNIEGKAYSLTKDDNATVGHEFNLVNNKVTNNAFVLEPVTQTLYYNGSINNIISLLGGGKEDLLASKLQSVRVLVYDKNAETYVNNNYLQSQFAKFSLNVVFNEEDVLQRIDLIINSAVNEVEHFKLEFETVYGNFDNVYDKNDNALEYFFTLSPSITINANYPIESSGNKERVKPSSKVNLLESFINENNRLQLVNNSVSYSIVGPTGSETRYGINNGTTTTYLPEGVKPFSYVLKSGPAKVNGDIIEFIDSGTTADAVITCVAFNGATLDYVFNVDRGTSNILIQANNHTLVADNKTPYNLFDYLSITNKTSGIKFIIKYQTLSTDLFLNESKTTKVLNSNQTLEYTDNGNEVLNMWFNDVDDVNGVKIKFLIWHNYNVSGDNPVELTITLIPNLVLQKFDANKNFAAGTEAVVMSNNPSSDVFIKLGNTNEEANSIELAVQQIKEAGTNTYRNVTANDKLKYGLTVTKQVVNGYTEYKLTTLNIGNAIGLKFRISKSGYYYEYEALLKPNANFNVNYKADGNTDENYYNIVGAASSEQRKAVPLNNLISPQTLAGNQIVEGANDDVTISFGLSFPLDKNSNITQAELNKIIPLIIASGNFSITVGTVNTEYLLHAEVSVSWKYSDKELITYTEDVHFRITPNIIEQGVSYSEQGATSLKVYAGSDIEFTLDDEVKLQQGSNYAAINAQQNLINGNKQNASVVIKAKSGENYSLTSIGTNKAKLTVNGYINDNVITFEVYYDLTGTLKGVIAPNAGDGAPFNSSKTLYKARYDLNIQIVPSLQSVTYTSTDADYSTSENAYNLHEKFDVLAQDKNDPYLGQQIKANEIDLTSILTFGLSSNLTFNQAEVNSDRTKILVNKYRLLNNISYKVSGSYGTLQTALTNELDETIALNSVSLNVRTDGENIYFVAIVAPPKDETNKFYQFKLTLTLPGAMGEHSQIDIYINFNLPTDKTVGGQIITPAPKSADDTSITMIDNQSDAAILKLTNTNPNNASEYLLMGRKGADSGAIETGLFRFGYLLGSAPNAGSEIINAYDSNKNITTTIRGATKYYIYELNSAKMIVQFNKPADWFTTEVRNGYTYLIVDPYYATGALENSEKRSIELTVTCGVVSVPFTLYIDPIIVSHSATITQSGNEYIINNNLIYNGSQNVNVTSKNIEINSGSLSAENLNIVRSWIVKNGNEFKIVPNRYEISEAVTFNVNAIINVGGDTSIDKRVYTMLTNSITIEPLVKFVPELRETTPDAVNNTELTNLISTNIFTKADISEVNVTLQLLNNSIDYSKYITVNNAAYNDVTKIYTLTNSTKISSIGQNLLDNVDLSFKAKASYKASDGKTYTYEKQFTLSLNKNAGISGFNDTYNITQLSDTTAKIDTSTGLNDITLTGSGAFEYEILGITASGGTIGQVSNEQVVVTPNSDYLTTKKITSLTFNWTKFKQDNPHIVNISGFTIKVFYKFNGVNYEIKNVDFRF